MKYTPNSKSKKFAVMRNEIVKFLLILVASFSATNAFCIPKKAKATFTFDNTYQELVAMETGYEVRVKGDGDESWSTNSPTRRHAGTYTIEYREIDEEADTYESFEVVINPYTLSPRLTGGYMFDYTGTPISPKFEVKYPYTSDVKVVFLDTEINNKKYVSSATEYGQYVAMYALEGEDAADYKIDYTTDLWYIVKPITLIWSDADDDMVVTTTYNGIVQRPAVEIDESQLLPDHKNVKFSNSYSAIQGALNKGTYTLKAGLWSDTDDHLYYRIINDVVTFVIEPRKVTCRHLTIATPKYRGEDYICPEFTTHASCDLSSDVTIKWTAEDAEGNIYDEANCPPRPGKYVVKQYVEGDTKGNYIFDDVTFEITKGDFYSTTFENYPKPVDDNVIPYDGESHLPLQLGGKESAPGKWAYYTVLGEATTEDILNYKNYSVDLKAVSEVGEYKVYYGFLPDNTDLYKFRAITWHTFTILEPEKKVPLAGVDFTAPAPVPYTEYDGNSKLTPGKANKGVEGHFEYCLGEDCSFDGNTTAPSIITPSTNSYIVRYRFIPDDKTMTSSEPGEVVVKVSKRGVQVEWDEDETLYYDGKPKLPTKVEISSKKPIVAGDDVVLKVYSEDGYDKVDAGSYSAIAKLEGKDADKYRIIENETHYFYIKSSIFTENVHFTKPVGKSRVYDGESKALFASGKFLGGNYGSSELQYRLLNKETLEPETNWSEEIIEKKDAGLYVVEYIAVGNKNMITSDPDTIHVIIKPAPLTVTWDQSDNLTYNAGRYNPQPEFVCADADKASFSKVMATLKSGDDDYNVGTFTMEIDLDDLKENVSGFENNYKYNSDDLTKTFTIKPFECEVSWSSGTAVYPTPTKGCSGAPKELSLKVSQIIDEEGGISYNDPSKFKGEPGDYIVVAVADVENPANYKLTNDNYKLTIKEPAMVEPLILFDFKGWTYGDTPTQEKLQSNPSGGEESYSYYYDEACKTLTDTKSGAVKAGGQPKNAGDYYIKVDVAAKGQYTATSAVKAFTIEKAPLTVTWDYTAPYPYDNKIHSPSATVECVEADKAAFRPLIYQARNGSDFRSPGKHTIELILDDVSVINNYELPDNLVKTFYIAEPAVAVVRDPIVYTDKKYQGRNHKVIVAEDPESIEGEPKGHYVFTYNEIESVSKIEFATPGSWTIQYQWISEDDTYSDGPKKDTLVSLGKVPVTFKWPEEEKRTFRANGEHQQITATTADIVDDDKDNVNIYYTIKLNGVKVDEAIEPGEYDIEAYLADGVAAYYDLTKSTCNATSKFTIVEPTLDPLTDLEMSIAGWKYGSTANTPKITAGNTCNGVVSFKYYTDEACVNATTVADGAAKTGEVPTQAGKYWVKATVAQAGTCDEGSVKKSFVIDTVRLTVDKWTIADVVYTGKVIEKPTAVFKDNFKYDDKFDAQVSYRNTAPYISDGKSVGTQYVRADVPEKYQNNYGINSTESRYNEFKITPAPLTVTWPKTELTYQEGKEQYPEPSITGEVNNEKITFSVTGKQTEVGEYTAKIVLDEPYATNYKIVESETSSASTPFSIVEPTLEPLTDLELSIEGWTYGGTANDPTITAGNKCKGTASFKYYTDAACTKATTTANGAATTGAKPANAGTYWVKATVAKAGTCDEGSVEKSFIIAKKSITVSWNNETPYTYKEGVSQKPSATAKDVDGKTIVLDVVVSGDGDGIEPGNYTATASLPEVYQTNYELAASVPESFSIVAPTLEPLTDLELSIEGWTFGETAKDPKFTKGNTCKGKESFKYYTDEACTTATTTDNGAAVAGGVPAYAGTYYVKGTVAPNESCGEGSVVAKFVIVPDTFDVIEWDIHDKVYDGLNTYRPTAKLKNISGTRIYNAFVSYEEDEINGGYYEGVKVGDQKVRADVDVEYRHIAYNFIIKSDDRFRTFMVTPAPLTVTWPETELTYQEGKEQAPVPNVTGEVNDEKAKYSVTGKQTEVGEYTATIVLEEPYATNYKIVESETSSASTTFNIVDPTVNPSVDLKLSIADWTYGSTPSTYEINSECEDAEIDYAYYTDNAFTVKTSDKNGASVNGGKPTYAGAYWVKATVTSGTCKGSTDNTSFKILKESLNIEWPEAEKLTYSEFVKVVPTKITKISNSKNSEEIQYEVKRSTEADADDKYTVTIQLKESSSNNYVIAEGASVKYAIEVINPGDMIPPLAEILTYDGTKQALLKAGTPKEGFQYALGVDGEWTDTIPAVKNANEAGYLVRWKFTPSDGSAVVTEEVTVPIKKFEINANIWIKREFTYNGEVHTPKVSVDGIKFKGDDLDVVVEGSASKCGRWPVTASLTGTSIDNYVLAEEQKENELVISVNNHFEFVTRIASCKYDYDGATHDLIIEGKYTDQTPGYFEYSLDGGEFTTTVPSRKDAKDYVIDWRYISSDECNVTTGGESGTITSTINKKDPKIEWGIISFPYDKMPHQPSPVLTDVNAGEDVTVEIVSVVPSPSVKVGTYTAKVKLSGADKDNYSLSEANLSKEFHITSKSIDRPAINTTEFTYEEGKTHIFFEDNGNYAVDGESSAMEPGTYNVKIVPADGYTWDDGTRTAIEKTFVINRIAVPYPDEDLTKFYYDGTVQTYKLAADSRYTISGNERKYVGSYDVIVSLNDIKHYMWSDGKHVQVVYPFVINTKTVKLPKVTSAKTYIYDGTEKQFDIAVDNGSILDESNPTGTDADTYTRTVSLDMDENGGYIWEDKTTEPKTFDFVIEPQPVIVPEVEETYFIFDNEIHQFIVPSDTADTPRYSVEMEVESAVGPDTFYATCSLNDKLNYVWDGGNSDDIVIEFIIGNGTIAKPNIEKAITYTGKPVTFVPKNSSYIVELRDKEGEIIENAVNADTYQVMVKPANGFAWLDFSNTPIIEKVRIVEAKIDKPVFNSPYTYNFGEELFRIPENDHYKISGDTFGIEPGKYKTTLTLEPNYMWNDSTKADYVINNEIKKISINIPKADSTLFVYSGEEQTYKIVADPVCKVTGNKQTIAGTYTVSVSITQPDYYMWSDNTVTNKTYKFLISRFKVNEPSCAKNTFEYNGSEHKFEISKNDKYIINNEVESATEVGTYYRTVSLIDTVNYTWFNGTVDDWSVKFTIVAASVQIPSVITEAEYTGEPIVFVQEGEGYTVTNGTKTDVGTYTVILSLKKGYIWSDGTSLDKEYPTEITPLYVPKPNVKEKTFPYNGSYYSFGFSPNDGYSFIGDTAAKEPGVYKVIVALNPNYIWDDETTENDTFTFNISKLDVSVPMANGSKFTYNGEEQTYKIVIPEDSLFTVANNVQTNAGTYTVTVSLKDHLHYQWGDSTIAPKTFDFVIGKARVQLPTAPRINFIYNEEEQILFVNPSDKYTVGEENEKATMPGEYERKVSLIDKNNYMWIDETTEDKTIKFIIGDGTLDSIAIKHDYVYTGDTIVFVPEDAAYIVENGFGVDAGTYVVKVKPSEGYRWSDSTKTERVDTVIIHPIMVEKPALVLNYTFNKKTINFNIPVSETYEIIGATSGIELGDYKVTLNLLPNHMWTDSTDNVAEYIFKINKIVVPVPPVDTTTYVYNGKRQSYNIAKDPNINVVGNPQIYAGTYDVTVLLSDIAHSMWSDSTTENKTYQFDIARAKVELPKAVQPTFAYDGNKKDFLVVENSRYEVLSKNASGTEVGSYERSVALKDTLNYTWIDGSVTNKNVTFIIENGVIDKPVFVKEYVYNGTQYTFVPENTAYTVENGVQMNAGTYEVIITLNPGYMWSDNSVEPIKDTVVIKPRPIQKPEFPAINIYTYDDSIRGVEIPDSDGYLVNGITQTKEPGTYEVIVSLQPNYIWADGDLEALKYVYTINKIVVEIPAQSDSVFKYTGTDVTYPIADTLDYYIVSGHHRTTAGLHYVTVSLSDSLHYIWSDGTTSDKIYEFLIGKFKVDLPRAVMDSFVYDGNIKLLDVVQNDHYSTERINGAAKEVGVYERKVFLNDTLNFLWADGSVDEKIVRFYILDSIIPSILVPRDLVYTGDSLTLIPWSSAYNLINNRALNAGVYDVIVLPNEGYTWPDSTKFARTISIRVKPQTVKIPVANPDTFEYSAKPHIFNLPISNDSLYIVTDNIQTEVGEYYAVASLKDSLNYWWSDTTNTPKLYSFVIKNTEFELGPIVQSKDMGMEATPGHLAVFDVQMSGNAYKYWITCDSCSGLNVDTVYFNGSVDAIDVFIPDTVQPGVYMLDVYFQSGTIVNSQKVTLRVNYPASDIYLVWGDVLTVDNSSNLFHTYQWYKNGEVIPGATRQYYQEKGNLDGYYSCLVNNELFVGPAYYFKEKPLWINAVGGNGTLNVEIVGTIPTGTTLGVYTLNAFQIISVEAEQFNTFEGLTPGVYIVKMDATEQAVKVIVK